MLASPCLVQTIATIHAASDSLSGGLQDAPKSLVSRTQMELN